MVIDLSPDLATCIVVIVGIVAALWVVFCRR